MQPPKLVLLPQDKFSDYKYDVIFNAYKWDPQVEDHCTISDHAAILCRETAQQLEDWAEQLAAETVLMENALLDDPKLAKKLGLPRAVVKALHQTSSHTRDTDIRLMRFDFHPTVDGWAVSEVNSDVPGGISEASALTQISAKYLDACQPWKNAAESIVSAFENKIKAGGTIALVYATSYSDDRQVMQCLSDNFRRRGFDTVFAAPDGLNWTGKTATGMQRQNIDGIARFFPAEWLINLPSKSNWQRFFDCDVPSCNRPAAMLTQSKRLPLLWDELNTEIPCWRKLLPQTKSPKQVDKNDESWLYKPILGRVGEGVSVKEAVSPKEFEKIKKAVKRCPSDWIAQKRFDSLPLAASDGSTHHLCIGVFTVDGKCAGFYGRLSDKPRIDAKAKDIPVLVANKQ